MADLDSPFLPLACSLEPHLPLLLIDSLFFFIFDFSKRITAGENSLKTSQDLKSHIHNIITLQVSLFKLKAAYKGCDSWKIIFSTSQKYDEAC